MFSNLRLLSCTFEALVWDEIEKSISSEIILYSCEDDTVHTGISIKKDEKS